MIGRMEWQQMLHVSNGVAEMNELVKAGASRRLIRRRVRDGAWQLVLPNVIVAHSGPISGAQRHRAAVLYCGAGTVLSHSSAGALHELRVTETQVDVTIPHGRRKPSIGFVEVHQSRRPSGDTWRSGLPCTNVARTVVDIAAQMRAVNDVRALVSDAVQRRLTTIDSIVAEAGQAPKRGSLLLNRVVAEVDNGARSAGEAAFLALIRRSGIPAPELNAELIVGRRRYVVDALWRDLGVVVEIDGMAWHLNGQQWQGDLQRQNSLHAVGLVVLRFPVARIRNDPDGVVAELRAVLRSRGLVLPAA